MIWLAESYAVEFNNFQGIVKIYRRDISYTLKQTSIRKENLFIFGTALGVSFLLDRGTRAYVLNHQNSNLRNVADFANNFGNGYVLFPAAVALCSMGSFRNDYKLLEASITSIESGITAGLVSTAIKISVGRERPYGTSNPFVFKPFHKDALYHSFPSGHAIMAWSMITPYAVYYKQPLLYLVPLSVNFARVYKNKHWLSDTIMSSGIGFAIGYFFADRHLNDRLVISFSGNNLLLGVRF